jgi:hypothetical protein
MYMPLFSLFTNLYYIYAICMTKNLFFLSDLQSATSIPPSPTSVLMVILPFRQRHKSTPTRPSPIVIRQLIWILHHIIGWIVVVDNTKTASYIGSPKLPPSTPTTIVHSTHFRKPRPSQPLRIKNINSGLHPPQNTRLYNSIVVSILSKTILPPFNEEMI